MAKIKGSSVAVPKLVQRQGEGHMVDLTVLSEGDGFMMTHLDFSSVPVPDRRFSADACSVQRDRSLIKLLLAQREPVGSGLLAMVVICMTFESAQQFMDSISNEFRRAFDEFSPNVPREELTDFNQPAQQTVVLNSSFVMAGYSGSQGCMDFYYASPFSMQHLAIYRKISLEPVVRVNLPATLIFAIVDRLRSMADSGELPLQERGERQK